MLCQRRGLSLSGGAVRREGACTWMRGRGRVTGRVTYPECRGTDSHELQPVTGRHQEGALKGTSKWTRPEKCLPGAGAGAALSSPSDKQEEQEKLRHGLITRGSHRLSHQAASFIDTTSVRVSNLWPHGPNVAQEGCECGPTQNRKSA